MDARCRTAGSSAASARAPAASPRTSAAPAARARTARGSSTPSSTRAPARSALDPVEKKPFFHVLPGSDGALARDRGLQPRVPRAARTGRSRRRGPSRSRRIDAAPGRRGDAGEAEGRPARRLHLHRARRLLRVRARHRRAGRPAGVRTVMVSNGYIQEQPLADLCREIAAYKVDLKGFDAGFFKQHTGGELKHVLETLRRLRRHGTWTEIVALVIPTLNDSEAETRALARFVRDELGADDARPLHPLPPVVPPAEPALDARSRRSTAAAPWRWRRACASSTSATCPATPARARTARAAARSSIRRFGMAVTENRMKGGRLPGLPPPHPRHLGLKSSIISAPLQAKGPCFPHASREVRPLRGDRRDRRRGHGPRLPGVGPRRQSRGRGQDGQVRVPDPRHGRRVPPEVPPRGAVRGRAQPPRHRARLRPRRRLPGDGARRGPDAPPA